MPGRRRRGSDSEVRWWVGGWRVGAESSSGRAGGGGRRREEVPSAETTTQVAERGLPRTRLISPITCHNPAQFDLAAHAVAPSSSLSLPPSRSLHPALATVPPSVPPALASLLRFPERGGRGKGGREGGRDGGRGGTAPAGSLATSFCVASGPVPKVTTTDSCPSITTNIEFPSSPCRPSVTGVGHRGVEGASGGRGGEVRRIGGRRNATE